MIEERLFDRGKKNTGIVKQSITAVYETEKETNFVLVISGYAPWSPCSLLLFPFLALPWGQQTNWPPEMLLLFVYWSSERR